MKKKLDIIRVEAFFFDFDGIFTNNKVIVNQDGVESVICNRNDGLGIKILKQYNKNIFILSSEKNKSVYHRSKKLKIKSYRGVANKKKQIFNISSNKYNLSNCLYMGNDINDFHAMSVCGIKICPRDSHKSIIDVSDFVLSKNGGDGLITCMLEEVFNINLLDACF